MKSIEISARLFLPKIEHHVHRHTVRLFLLQNDAVVCVDKKDGTNAEKQIENGATGIFATDQNAVRVLYAARADYLMFD